MCGITLGLIAAGTAIGAAVGAGTAAIKGGNILKGALFGGLGGAIGGGVGSAFTGAVGGAASGFASGGMAGAMTGASAGAAAGSTAGGLVGGAVGGLGGGLLSAKQDEAKRMSGLAIQSANAQKQEAIKQIKQTQNNGISAIQQTATGLKNRITQRRTLGSLRIGLNTGEAAATGLNIPT